MSQNSENIEAKLAMYVDGTLDEAGKAEIERHLAVNPQHRKLLADLILTRQWLLKLPRAEMPAEISESLQGQLERSVLLDERAAAASSAIRVNRFPQMVALAASVLLAVGLAGVVYFVVAGSQSAKTYTITEPAGKPADGEAYKDGFATSKESAKLDAAPLVLPEAARLKEESELDTSESGAGEATAKKALTKDVASHADVPANLEMPDALAAKAGAPEVLGRAVQADDEPMRSNRHLSDADLAVPFVVLVSAEDPVVAHDQILMYLLANAISWESLAEDGSVLPQQPVEPVEKGLPGDASAAVPATTRSTQPTTQNAEASPELVVADTRDATPAAEPALPGAGSNVIFARQMTRRQAAELSERLEQPKRNQRALLVEQRRNPEGDQLVVRGRRKVREVKVEQRDPTTQTTQPVTQPATQQAPIDSKLIVDAPEATTRPATIPSTQPAELGTSRDESDKVPSIELPPPAQMLDAEDEERIDVLIVVRPVAQQGGAVGAEPPASAQPLPEVAPATAPATQPATQSLPTTDAEK